MSAVEIVISGILFDKYNRTQQHVVLIGDASLAGLGVGGGPIVPPPGGGSPPGIWPSPGVPTHPIYFPPWWPGAPTHPIPPGIWPSPPIPPIEGPPVEPPPNPSEPKPPPPGGGWGWHPEYGWGYFPGGKPHPIP